MVNIKRIKYACYSSSISMSVVANLTPLLFITFRNLYGFSYSLLGMLVLINFVSQLIIDLIFSAFSYKFDVDKIVKCMPILTFSGFAIFAVAPTLPTSLIYPCMVFGTIAFSAAAGFGEVLTSPIIAALPSDEPDREMSKLHSVYAWGVVVVVIISTLFLYLFGAERWQTLILIWMTIPTVTFFMFMGQKLPDMETPQKLSGVIEILKNKGVWLCVTGIFFGGAAECTMAQWSSGYLEMAIGLPKIWGDIFGVALFAAMLGLGRSMYAKRGRNIEKVIVISAFGAVICYFMAAILSNAIVGLVVCALTGLFTSMLWPGNLTVATDRYPQGGILIYALMAAGGDLGASVGPQLIGIVTDVAIKSNRLIALANTVSLQPEQLGLKLGMLLGGLFPLLGTIIYLKQWKDKRSKTKTKQII